jgi:short-subunit dehydrogenase
LQLELDVTDFDEVARAARDCGDVSLVVNNAGLFSNQTLLGAADMSVARQEMEVNYFGTLAMCRAFAPVLARNGGGGIINVLSAAALCPIPNEATGAVESRDPQPRAAACAQNWQARARR